MFDAEFFFTIAFILFLGLLGYVGLHTRIIGALDKRTERISAELAEAARLRAEAEALVASFEKKKAEAEAEAQAIIAHARTEAELIAREAHDRIAEFVRRRTRQAEDKIKTAETAAAAEVRAAAADAATKAAEVVLKARAEGEFGDELVSRGIADLKRLMH
jgi:F-type H+-transporting ATPase subunit b